MFHYCLGKILAEKLGLAFDVPDCFVDWKGDPVSWSSDPIFKMITTEGPRYSQNKALNFGAYHWYDFDSIPKGRAVHVCYGHWCRYEIYRAYKQTIREQWLKIPEHRFLETDNDAVYVHARRTDFVDLAGIPKHFQSTSTPYEDFKKCLDAAQPFKRIVVVTDGPEDPFCETFKQYGVPVDIQSKHWDEDFLTLASCKKLIMSCSTYSWWAGFLGKAEKIYCPITPETYWAYGLGARGAEREQYPNLYVDDEPGRWFWVT